MKISNKLIITDGVITLDDEIVSELIPLQEMFGFAIQAVVTPDLGAPATAVLNITADITFTSVADGTARNTTTIKTLVNAAAPNPGATILVAFTGTAAAIVATITPNDGTNNGAVPVALTTANFVQLVNTGAVTGKTITLTDASNFRILQTATGGGPQAFADSGEGDDVTATFSGGVDTPDIITGELQVQVSADQGDPNFLVPSKAPTHWMNYGTAIEVDTDDAAEFVVGDDFAEVMFPWARVLWIPDESNVGTGTIDVTFNAKGV